MQYANIQTPLNPDVARTVLAEMRCAVRYAALDNKHRPPLRVLGAKTAAALTIRLRAERETELDRKTLNRMMRNTINEVK